MEVNFSLSLFFCFDALLLLLLLLFDLFINIETKTHTQKKKSFILGSFHCLLSCAQLWRLDRWVWRFLGWDLERRNELRRLSLLQICTRGRCWIDQSWSLFELFVDQCEIIFAFLLPGRWLEITVRASFECVVLFCRWTRGKPEPSLSFFVISPTPMK